MQGNGIWPDTIGTGFVPPTAGGTLRIAIHHGLERERDEIVA